MPSFDNLIFKIQLNGNSRQFFYCPTLNFSQPINSHVLKTSSVTITHVWEKNAPQSIILKLQNPFNSFIKKIVAND